MCHFPAFEVLLMSKFMEQSFVHPRSGIHDLHQPTPPHTPGGTLSSDEYQRRYMADADQRVLALEIRFPLKSVS
jgi:hypothetical protein